MSILLLFTDQCSRGDLYLFQPVRRDGEVLLDLKEVLKERRGRPSLSCGFYAAGSAAWMCETQ